MQATSEAQPFVKGNFVAGEWVEGLQGRWMPIINPATEKVIAEVPMGSAADVERAVAAAKRASRAWREAPPRARAAALYRLAEVIDEHAHELTLLESQNVGKPLAVAREEIPLCSDSLRFLGGAARALTVPASDEYVSGHMSVVRREPHGVIAAIAPWNYPLMMAIWKLAPALATGNTVVLKPAEQTPITVLRLMELAQGVLPPGVLNIVTGEGEPVGEALARHRDIAMVSLTGSVQTGRRVAGAAAATLKHVHLELGGKAPVLVFADADMDAVAEAIRVFGYWNSGQECGSATRVLVQRTAYDDLMGALEAQVKGICVGDPAEGDMIEMGPLISAEQRARVLGFLDRATSDGAQITIGGETLARPGFFLAPTVVTEAGQHAEIIQEEVFGPVVTVQPFADEEQSLAMANDCEYGLCASVWTGSASRSLRLARDLDFGTVWINAHLALASEMPWGGFKQSGYGKDMSILGLESYTRVKHIMARFQGVEPV